MKSLRSSFKFTEKILGENFSAINPTQFDEAGGEKTKYPDAANILTSQQFPKNANFVHILCLFRVIFI